MVHKMLAGQILGKRCLEMVEIPIPEINDGELLVRLEIGSICGTISGSSEASRTVTDFVSTTRLYRYHS